MKKNINFVIQTAFVGDLFLSIPFLINLKKIYPDDEIYILCRKGMGDFFIRTGLVQKAYEMDKKDKKNISLVLKQIYSLDYKSLFCLHESFRSHIISYKISAKNKYSFTNLWNSMIFTKSLQKDLLMPDALRQLSLLNLVSSDLEEKIKNLDSKIKYNLKIKESTKNYFLLHRIPEWASMDVSKQIYEKDFIDRYLNKSEGFDLNKKNIFIAPGSVWKTKQWILSKFINVAKVLLNDFNVILVGSSAEKEICLKIKNELSKTINLTGKTSLYELAGLFKQGSLLLTNDSGAMHVAAASGLAVVSVFGPTTLSIGYRPWVSEASVIQKDMDCRPCGKHGHTKCPIKIKDHKCMSDISESLVLDEIYSLYRKLTDH